MRPAHDPKTEAAALLTAEMPVLASADVLEIIGGYPIVRLIGQGEQSRVFECVDAVTPPPMRGRHVALKVLMPGEDITPSMVERMQREARALSCVRSPNVCHLFAYGVHEGSPYFVLELLDGEDLQTRLERLGRLAPREAVRTVREAVRGLKAAFDVGVVHGTIRPSALVVHKGRIKVTDFGVAPLIRGTERVTQQRLFGVPAFLAPERVRGHAADSKSDMYSLGATLYTLLTGKPPFEGTDAAEILVCAATIDPPALTASVPGASADLVLLLKRLMAKDPAARARSWDEVLALCDEILSSSILPGSVDVDSSLDDRDGEALPPPPIADLAPVYPNAAPTGVMGALRQMGVAEIAQVLELGRKTACVDIEPAEGDSGRLAASRGQVVYAVCGALRGDEAFYALARHKAGFFRIHYGEEAPARNIQVPTQLLLLEAMRRIDESAAGSATRAASETSADMPPLSEVSDAFGIPPAPTAPTLALASSSKASSKASSWKTSSKHTLVRLRTAVLPAWEKARAAVAPVRSVVLPAVQAHAARIGATVVRATSSFSAWIMRTAPLVAGRVQARSAWFAQQLRTGSTAGIAFSQARLAALRSRVLPQIRSAVVNAVRSTWQHLRFMVLSRRPGWQPGLDRFETLAQHHAPKAALALVLVVAGVAATHLAPEGRSHAELLARIDAGDAAGVLADIDDTQAPERVAMDVLLRGHALHALGQHEDAVASWRTAAQMGAIDPRVLETLLTSLAWKHPNNIEVLTNWPASDDLHGALVQRLTHKDWHIRHNSRRLLDERRELGLVDLEPFALVDLASAKTCAKRRQGLELLTEVGRTGDALAAIERAAASRTGDNACLAADLGAARDAVRKRVQEQAVTASADPDKP